MPASLDRIDHVHVFVTDRAKAEVWYTAVLNLCRDPKLEFWSSDGGPLMLRNASGSIMLSVFERPAQATRSIIAFGVEGDQFMGWISHLDKHLDRRVEVVDHEVCWSVYFADPNGNPFEITCYDYHYLSHLELRARTR